MAAVKGFDGPDALRAIGQPVTIVRPQDGLWDASGEAARLVPGATLIDAPQWGFGLFDAHAGDVARLVRSQLDE